MLCVWFVYTLSDVGAVVGGNMKYYGEECGPEPEDFVDSD